MTSNAEVLRWQRFFLAAGIPGAVALKYSKSFAEQRMQFTMLDALDKSVLVELGIVTVGDQIAVLQYIQKLKSRKESGKEGMNKSSAMETDNMSIPREQKATSVAPDRDDIYHVHLPIGTTPKTRAILQKHSMLKSAGLLKRGSTGVRQSGKDIVPLSKQNNTIRQSNTTNSKCSANGLAASSEVSSTTDEFYGRLGIRGLVSDQLGVRKFSTGNTSMHVSSPRNLFERAVNESASDRVAEPVFRVRLNEMKAWNHRRRINDSTQTKFIGAIRKRKIQSTVPLNTARLNINTKRIFGRDRPSVFYRLS